MKKRLSNKKIPYHLGLIIDGNRRWAKKKGLPILAGHRKGIRQIKIILKYALKKGIKIITIYAFSTENWKRDKEEVNNLMSLFKNFVVKITKDLVRQQIKIRTLGNVKKLPISLQKSLKKLINLTKNNKKMIVNIALNYGGRDEIVRAFKKIIASKPNLCEINEKLINQNLDTAGLPYPDFIIRTSGEQRLSNFLLWQIAYSELYFPKVYWPDFGKKEFDIALKEFQKRRRRCGQ